MDRKPRVKYNADKKYRTKHIGLLKLSKNFKKRLTSGFGGVIIVWYPRPRRVADVIQEEVF